MWAWGNFFCEPAFWCSDSCMFLCEIVVASVHLIEKDGHSLVFVWVWSGSSLLA